MLLCGFLTTLTPVADTCQPETHQGKGGGFWDKAMIEAIAIRQEPVHLVPRNYNISHLPRFLCTPGEPDDVPRPLRSVCTHTHLIHLESQLSQPL